MTNRMKAVGLTVVAAVSLSMASAHADEGLEAAARQLAAAAECSQAFDRVIMGDIVRSVEARLRELGWSEKRTTDFHLKHHQYDWTVPREIDAAFVDHCATHLNDDEAAMAAIYGRKHAPRLPPGPAPAAVPVGEPIPAEDPVLPAPASRRVTASQSELLRLMSECTEEEASRPDRSRGGVSVSEFCAAAAVVEGSR